MLELVTTNAVTAMTVYGEPQGVDRIISEIENQVSSFVPDLSTPSGRKEIASVAYKVAQSKTYLVSLGKGLTKEWKEKAKKVDEQIRYITEKLDSLKDKVRQPLTEWEEEQERIKKEEAERIELEKQYQLDWDSAIADNMLFDAQKKAKEDAEKLAKERAEFEKLKAELQAEKDRIAKEEEKKKAEIERIEREKRIAEEAKKQAEKDAAERIEKERIAAEKKRLADIKAAELKAEAEKQAIIKAQLEKERIEAERIAKQKAEDEKRRADEEYRNHIRQETIDSLIGNAGITQQLASIIFMLIATNKIAHVKLEY